MQQNEITSDSFFFLMLSETFSLCNKNTLDFTSEKGEGQCRPRRSSWEGATRQEGNPGLSPATFITDVIL